MNVLSIGNSFSQDAQRYLHRIAKVDGFEMNTVNLYIGGCPLSTHFFNMHKDAREYLLEVNGISTGFYVSIKEALLNRCWDVVTLQQVSHLSHDYDTYQPYLDALAECVRLYAPKAKIVIHQTWAYEDGSSRLTEWLGYKDSKSMFDDIKKAYKKAAKDIKADFIIPSGELVQNLVTSGIGKVHRDTFHLGYGCGRYAVALLWYKKLTGASAVDNKLSDFDEEITHEQLRIIKNCVDEM